MEYRAPEDFAAIYGNVQLLQGWLSEQSAEIERNRELPVSVVEELSAAGVFRMNMPRTWGGPELTSMDQAKVIEVLSEADASAGWCAMIGCDSGIYSGYLEDTVARNLYPHLDMVQAGWVYPIGRAEEIDGGYKVTGQWKFCSGSSHADIIAAGCTVFRKGEPVMGVHGLPEWRLMLAPASHWKLLDTWDTTGLRGTASHDYTTLGDYLLIPREHSFSFLSPVREGPLWSRPDTILRKMSGVPLGLARRAILDATEILESKTDRLGSRPVKQSSSIKINIAEAEMLYGSARSYVMNALESEWESLLKGTPLTVRQRSDLWLSRLNAFQVARRVSQLMYDTVGADAIYRQHSSLDRICRDAITMCQHLVGQRKSLEEVGGLLLGTQEGPGSPML